MERIKGYSDFMYPDVVDEHATIAKLLEGYSIARFGDGEIKIVLGAGYSREPANGALTAEMRMIIRGGAHPRTLVGIWTKDPRIPKFESQVRYRAKFVRAIRPDLVTYYSSTISRPDASPWIFNVDYARMVESLWRGKNAVVVCERKGSMHGTVRLAARKAWHVECPRREAYAHIDRLEDEVVAMRPDVAILSAGPTATCLADRLTYRGIQAIDLGSAGGWLRGLLT